MHARFGEKYFKFDSNMLWQYQMLVIASTMITESKHDTFRRDSQTSGAGAIYLKRAYVAQGDIFFSEKGLGRLGSLPRPPTLEVLVCRYHASNRPPGRCDCERVKRYPLLRGWGIFWQKSSGLSVPRDDTK